MKDRRQNSLNRYKTDRISALFPSRTTDVFPVVDISQEAMLIRCMKAHVGGDVVELRDNSDRMKLSLGFVLDPEQDKRDGHQVIKFTEPLTPSEVSFLAGQPVDRDGVSGCDVRRAEEDMREVQQRIRATQKCRTDVFLAVVGTLTAATITLGCITIQQELHRGTLLLGASLGFTLFVLGIMVTIEKARSVNSMKGWSAMMSECLARGAVPSRYRGWSSMIQGFCECGARMRADGCGLGLRSKEGPTCASRGWKSASDLNHTKRPWTGIFDSFMSLTTFAYTVIYAGLTGLFAYVLRPAIAPWSPLEFASRLMFVFAGAIAVFVLLRVFGTLKRVLVGGCLCVLGSMLAEHWVEKAASIGVLCGCGAILGLMACYLARQLIDLRRGKHSVESFYFTWQNVHRYCVPFAQVPSSRTILKATWRDKVVRWTENTLLNEREKNARG